MKVTAPVRIDISAGWPDSDPYRKEYSGAVLNAAINLRVGAEFIGWLKIDPCEVPSHSGLGTSGALRAVELVASNPSLLDDKTMLIRKIWHFENAIIGHRAGFQDEAAAIYGGVNLWKFGKLESLPFEFVPIEKEEIKEERAKHLEDRIVLFHTAEDHLSANIHSLVFGIGNYEKNIPKLGRMKAIAYEMRDNLTDEKKMADLMAETWELQKSLHESIETDFMKELQEEARGGYLACRAVGAGGGGSMIFYSNEKKDLTNFLQKFKKGRVIPFNFEYEGIRIEE